MKPYRVQGTKIEVLRRRLDYRTPEGEEKSLLELDEESALFQQNRLAADGCTDFTLTEVDTSDVDWLDGIEIGETRSPMAEADRIYAMGEEAYLAQKNALTVEQQLMLTQLRQQQTIDALIMAQLGGGENV